MKMQIKTVSVTLAAGVLIARLAGAAFVYFGAFDVVADVPHSRPMLALMDATRDRSVEVAFVQKLPDMTPEQYREIVGKAVSDDDMKSSAPSKDQPMKGMDQSKPNPHDATPHKH